MKIKRNTVQVSDDTGRIATLETRTFGIREDDGDSDPTLVRYIYSNHLQSASLKLDKDAEIISYEEYHPYGTTAYQAKSSTINAVAKRYRYTGKERDEESGLYYHGARYYVPWLCRWTACDPLERDYAGMSSYQYANNNPTIYDDPSGMAPPGPGPIKKLPFQSFMPPFNPIDDIGPDRRRGDKSFIPKHVPTVPIKKIEPQNKESVGHSFFVGFAKGIAIGALAVGAAVAITALTGGLAGPAAAAAVGSILADVGVAMTAYATVPVVTGYDYDGNKLTDNQRAEAGGELLGSLVGGAATAKGISTVKSFVGTKKVAPTKINYENFGSEALDIPAMEEQPITVQEMTPKVIEEPLDISETSVPVSYNFGKYNGNFFSNAEQIRVDLKIPENWIAKASKVDGGVKFSDPSNSGNHVRVMPGRSNSKFINSQEPYTVRYKNGAPVDASGNQIPNSTGANQNRAAELHVPLKKFQF